MTQLVRGHNFCVSSDGYAAGEGQTLEHPFGHADPALLVGWAGATDSWPNRADPGGSRGLDDYLVRDFHSNVGAEIMGRNTACSCRVRPGARGVNYTVEIDLTQRGAAQP